MPPAAGNLDSEDAVPPWEWRKRADW